MISELLTPSWKWVLPGLISSIHDTQTMTGRVAAETELRRMAALADKYVRVVEAQDALAVSGDQSAFFETLYGLRYSPDRIPSQQGWDFGMEA